MTDNALTTVNNHQQADAWALVCAHVNTAPPPPVYPSEPVRVPVSHQLPARAASLIRPAVIKDPDVRDFVRRFRVAHSDNAAALDALIRGVAV